MSLRTPACLTFTLLALTASAQTTTLRGGVSADSGPTLPQIYAGQDPLKGKAEIMPTMSTGDCDPVPTWVVVYKTKTTCYFFVPFQVPLQGQVVTPAQAGQYQWDRCSAHPWDTTLFICYGTPRPKYNGGVTGNGGGPGGSGPGGIGPSGGPGGYSPGGLGPGGGIPISGGPVAGSPGWTYGPAANGGLRPYDPCHPYFDMSTPAGRAQAAQAGPQTQQACNDERCKHNPQLQVCKQTFNTPPPVKPADKPGNNPIANTIDYVHGITDGLGDCIKSFGDLLVGAGYFAKGDFVNAARTWGMSPGQSVTLKAIAAELSQQVVGGNVSAYDQGKIAGRRICNYGLVPGLTKAGGTILRSGTPGATVLNPLKGGALMDAATNNPAKLAGQYIQTGKGPVQLGGFLGSGNFGSVFKLPNGRVMKIQNSLPGSAESFPRQLAGSQRLQRIGVDTPKIYDMEPGGANVPATLTMDDVFQKWPGAYQLGTTEFNKLAGAARNQVTGAIANVANKLGDAGYVWPDGHINNMMFRPNGSGLSAIVHDADMILTVPETQAALANATSIPGAVLRTALENVGLDGVLKQPLSAPSLMNALYRARFGGALGGNPGGGSGTVTR